MINFNGFVESGAFSGSSPTQFFTNSSLDLESRLEGLDEKDRREVRKRIGEFHTVEEMEMFIKQKTGGRKNIT